MNYYFQLVNEWLPDRIDEIGDEYTKKRLNEVYSKISEAIEDIRDTCAKIVVDSIVVYLFLAPFENEPKDAMEKAKQLLLEFYEPNARGKVEEALRLLDETVREILDRDKVMEQINELMNKLSLVKLRMIRDLVDKLTRLDDEKAKALHEFISKVVTA